MVRILFGASMCMVILLASLSGHGMPATSSPATAVQLPAARTAGAVSIEEALLKRRSVRRYRSEALTLAQVSQLLWAAQGVTDPRGFRAAPSAGATYPLETYVVAGAVSGLSPGVYKYRPATHDIVMVAAGDRRRELMAASYGQTWVGSGPMTLVFCAVYERTTGRYGKRGVRFVDMEAGHASQNVYLQAVSLGLGTVAVGAFDEDQVARVVQSGRDEVPLYMMSVGQR